MPAIFILSNNLLCWKILPNYYNILYLKARREGCIIVLSKKIFKSSFCHFLANSLNFGARAWGLEQAYEEPKMFKKVRQKCKKIKPFFFLFELSCQQQLKFENEFRVNKNNNSKYNYDYWLHCCCCFCYHVLYWTKTRVQILDYVSFYYNQFMAESH